MKKYLSLIFVLILTVCLFSACGTPKEIDFSVALKTVIMGNYLSDSDNYENFEEELEKGLENFKKIEPKIIRTYEELETLYEDEKDYCVIDYIENFNKEFFDNKSLVVLTSTGKENSTELTGLKTIGQKAIFTLQIYNNYEIGSYRFPRVFISVDKEEFKEIKTVEVEGFDKDKIKSNISLDDGFDGNEIYVELKVEYSDPEKKVSPSDFLPVKIDSVEDICFDKYLAYNDLTFEDLSRKEIKLVKEIFKRDMFFRKNLKLTISESGKEAVFDAIAELEKLDIVYSVWAGS